MTNQVNNNLSQHYLFASAADRRRCCCRRLFFRFRALADGNLISGGGFGGVAKDAKTNFELSSGLCTVSGKLRARCNIFSPTTSNKITDQNRQQQQQQPAQASK